jgi:hypothetical protein
MLAWGFIGLQLSDRAEERYFKPTEEDRAALREMAPRITAVERESGLKNAVASHVNNTEK